MTMADKSELSSPKHGSIRHEDYFVILNSFQKFELKCIRHRDVLCSLADIPSYLLKLVFISNAGAFRERKTCKIVSLICSN